MKELELENIRRMYPKNTVIKLEKMEDPQAPPVGTLGRVDFVDDAGQIHMKWDNGSSLALIPEKDLFEIVKENDKYIPSTIEASFDHYLSVEEAIDELEKEDVDI